jgi:hypothetical protein
LWMLRNVEKNQSVVRDKCPFLRCFHGKTS